jgi:hypothetical protein
MTLPEEGTKGWLSNKRSPAAGGRPAFPADGAVERSRLDGSTLVASNDARVHSPLPWSKCSLLVHFPPALLNTTRRPRVSYLSLFIAD